MSKTPKLRFKEFSGDWESKKLGDVAQIVGGGTPSTTESEYWNGNIPWFTPTEIKSEKFVSISERTITEEGLKKSSAKILPKGTVLLTTRASLGDMAIANQEVTTNQGFQSIIAGKDVNNEFIYYLQPKLKKYCYKNASGSTFLEISKSNIEQFKFNMPSIEEQEKIASFFSLIDEKISLQGEKVEALKDYKKGMMQKIFSRELRFKDDEGRDYPEWEEKKITEVAKTSIGLVTTMTENYVEDGVKLIRNSDIKENKIKKDNLINLDIEFAAQNEHRKLKINDVVTVHTGDIGTSAVIDEDMDGCLGFATLNTRPDNNIIDSHYLCHYFNSFRNKKYAIRMSTGDGRSNYNLKDFNNANILIPCIEEQKKIVNVLSNIDLKLDKEQEKLDSLNEYKKGLLQQMFV